MAGMTDTAKLGWVIAYVPDVRGAIEFYERAFGLAAQLRRRGRVASGSSPPARRSSPSRARQLGDSHFEGGFERPGERPFNVEVALVFDDVPAAFARARECGAAPLSEPKETPWGQVVAYVRDPFGTLVELATPTG